MKNVVIAEQNGVPVFLATLPTSMKGINHGSDRSESTMTMMRWKESSCCSAENSRCRPWPHCGQGGCAQSRPVAPRHEGANAVRSHGSGATDDIHGATRGAQRTIAGNSPASGLSRGRPHLANRCPHDSLLAALRIFPDGADGTIGQLDFARARWTSEFWSTPRS